MDVGQPDESWLWWISVQPDAETRQWDVALRSVVMFSHSGEKAHVTFVISFRLCVRLLSALLPLDMFP
jgi:hypothetical protein